MAPWDFIMGTAPKPAKLCTYKMCVLCDASNNEESYTVISTSGEMPCDHLFVDSTAEVVYELQPGTMKLYSRDGEGGSKYVMHVRQVDYDGNSIRVEPGLNGFESGVLLRSNGPLTNRENDWYSIAKTKGSELTRADYLRLYGSMSTIHLKGFGPGVSDVYDQYIVERLKSFEVVVWDGEHYEEDSYTRIIPKYLNNSPKGIVIAFQRKFKVPAFDRSWAPVMAKHEGRIFLLPIDERDPELAEADVCKGIIKEVDDFCDKDCSPEERNAFVLARIALCTTGAKEVVALGGEGPISWQAEASFREKVHWTVYAASRGKPEQRASLCDFARNSLMGKSRKKGEKGEVKEVVDLGSTVPAAPPPQPPRTLGSICLGPLQTCVRCSPACARELRVGSAADRSSKPAHVDLVMGRDENEQDAFAS